MSDKGTTYGMYLYTPEPETLARIRRLVRCGHPQALYELGRLHFHGLGVSKNPGLAFVLYKRAAVTGNYKALYELARWYGRGPGLIYPSLPERDPIEGLMWSLLATSQEAKGTWELPRMIMHKLLRRMTTGEVIQGRRRAERLKAALRSGQRAAIVFALADHEASLKDRARRERDAMSP